VRLDVVADDVTAMIGACTVGERELKALLGRYGLEVFQEATRGLLDAAEQSARAVISEIPDGTYRAEWYVNDDGIDHDRRWTIRVAITVEGDRMVFDFAGTDDQATGYVNAPLAVTLSSVMIAFFMIAAREVPHNDGVMRCIEGPRAGGEHRQPGVPGADGLWQPSLRPDRGADHACARGGGADAGAVAATPGAIRPRTAPTATVSPSAATISES